MVRQRIVYVVVGNGSRWRSTFKSSYFFGRSSIKNQFRGFVPVVDAAVVPAPSRAAILDIIEFHHVVKFANGGVLGQSERL